jgi:hypothetical protein
VLGVRSFSCFLSTVFAAFFALGRQCYIVCSRIYGTYNSCLSEFRYVGNVPLIIERAEDAFNGNGLRVSITLSARMTNFLCSHHWRWLKQSCTNDSNAGLAAIVACKSLARVLAATSTRSAVPWVASRSDRPNHGMPWWEMDSCAICYLDTWSGTLSQQLCGCRTARKPNKPQFQQRLCVVHVFQAWSIGLSSQFTDKNGWQNLGIGKFFTDAKTLQFNFFWDADVVSRGVICLIDHAEAREVYWPRL